MVVSPRVTEALAKFDSKICMQPAKFNAFLRLHKQAPSESSLLPEIAFAIQISDVRGGLKSFFGNGKELYLKRMRPKLHVPHSINHR